LLELELLEIGRYSRLLLGKFDPIGVKKQGIAFFCSENLYHFFSLPEASTLEPNPLMKKRESKPFQRKKLREGLLQREYKLRHGLHQSLI